MNARTIISAATLVSLTASGALAQVELVRSVFGSGGGTTGGGAFELATTTGQTVAGPTAGTGGGGAFVISAGFWIPSGPVVPPCPADFNLDGDLNGDDLADFINAFFSVPPAAGTDFNNDGNTDADDLADYINAFFAGGC